MLNRILQMISLCVILYASPLFPDKIRYPFTTDPIDVVIPCVPADLSTLDLCIKGIRKNGKGVRRVIVVSPETLTDQAEWFDEKLFPFTKQDICLAMFHNDSEAALQYSSSSDNRLGWIYQQLLKFYAYQVIPNISPNILILDADTIFLNPVKFIDRSGAPFFAIAKEYHQPYFEHMKRLLPWLTRQTNDSGITHHMLFQKCVLDDFFQMIEKEHSVLAWQALSACIQDRTGSGISEYEIYFNFIFSRTDQAHIRPLIWRNRKSLKVLKKDRKKGVQFVSCHRWMRKNS